MAVKMIAVTGYLSAWGVIVLGVFRTLPWAVWFTVLALVFFGSIAAWNALPNPNRQPVRRCTEDCNGRCNTATQDASQDAAASQQS